MTKFLNSQKGISLYITLIITSIILAIALGVSLVLVGQLKMTKEIGDSTKAFYAADAGIEMAMNKTIDEIISDNVADGNNGEYEFFLDGTGDYKYKVYVVPCNEDTPGANCKLEKPYPWDTSMTFPIGSAESACSDLGAQYFCYWSRGYYKDITRAIEVIR